MKYMVEIGGRWLEMETNGHVAVEHSGKVKDLEVSGTVRRSLVKVTVVNEMEKLALKFLVSYLPLSSCIFL